MSTDPQKKVEFSDKLRVKCDGGGGALGHPLIWLQIPKEGGFVVCPYCDKKFIYKENS